jgi:tetratricopeptide (TPR) repeat protein
MAKGKDKYSTELLLFQTQLKVALTHFHDPSWLGTNSPLATPYFLAHLLRKQPKAEQAFSRGEALRQLLVAGIEALQSEPIGTHDIAGKLLDLSYIQCKKDKEIEGILGYSRTQLWRIEKDAFPRLEQKLMELVNPLLRSEKPIEPASLFERNDQIQQVKQMIDERKLIGLAGPSGSGKTSLAATIVRGYHAQRTLWITIRQGLNDGVKEFLFSLGFFLRTSCNPSVPDLWFQIVADQSRTMPQNMQAYLGLVCHSLTACMPPPLICIDDADLLDPTTNTEHARLCDLIQHLQSVVPILVIGQRLPLLCDFSISLPGLSQAATAYLLREQGIVMTNNSQLVESAHRFTKGNPRVINLIAALLKAGEPEESVLDALTQSIATDSLIRRLWRRLGQEQQTALARLSVYRKAVPLSAIHQVEDVPRGLAGLHLADIESHTGISINAAYRPAILSLISSEILEKLHREAGLKRAELGEYTEAAHHLVSAGDYDLALKLWSQHRTQEMNQGQGRVAYSIFSTLSERLFSKGERRSFLLIRAELMRLVGEYDAAEQGIDAISIQEGDDTALAAVRQKSDLQYLRNNTDGAVTTLREGLQLLNKRKLAEEHEVALRVRLSQMLGERYNFAAANYEAQIAQFEVTYLFGLLAEFTRKLPKARSYYEQALALSVETKYREGEAKCRASLGVVQAYLHDFDPAEQNHQQALTLYRELGRVSQIDYRTSESAVLLNLAGRYEEAIEIGESMLAKAEVLGDTRFVAAVAHNLAESYLATGRLREAEEMIEKSLRQEEANPAPDSLRVVGEIHLAHGRMVLAEENIKQSIKAAQEMPDDFLEAYAWRALSRVYRARSDEQLLQKAFDNAIALFERCGADGEVQATRQIKNQK